MDNVLERIKAACRGDKPYQNLEQLVYLLSAQGFSRQEIYEIFHNVRITMMYSRDWLALEEKNRNHHPVDIIIDRLGGFCNPKYILLRHESFVDKERKKTYNSTDRYLRGSNSPKSTLLLC